jgi:hypothetical protein
MAGSIAHPMSLTGKREECLKGAELSAPECLRAGTRKEVAGIARRMQYGLAGAMETMDSTSSALKVDSKPKQTPAG